MIARIYLDANALETRWPQISGELRILASVTRLSGVELCIPRSVLVEHELSTWRRTQESVLKAAKQINEINSRLAAFYGRLGTPTVDEATFHNTYARSVEEARRIYGIQITPTTTKSLEDLVAAAARHDAPFKDEDRGFRDAVHLQSAIDDLRNRPMPRESEAVFISHDGRLLRENVSELIRTAGVSLRCLASVGEVVAAVREALGDRAGDSEMLQRATDMWLRDLLDRTAQDLVPRLNLKGFDLGRNTTLEAVLNVEVRHESGTWAVGVRENNQYPVNYEVRLSVAGIGRRRADLIPDGAPPSYGFLLTVVLLLDVNCVVTVGPDLRILDVSFTSGRAFCVIWNTDRENYDIENLAESVELLTV